GVQTCALPIWKSRNLPASNALRVRRRRPMTNIVVLVKQVPDTYSERKLNENDHTLDRESADAVIDEINERAVEEALQIKEANGGEVTVLCVGPDRATDAIRKALSMGADTEIGRASCRESVEYTGAAVD